MRPIPANVRGGEKPVCLGPYRCWWIDRLGWARHLAGGHHYSQPDVPYYHAQGEPICAHWRGGEQGPGNLGVSVVAEGERQ